jgi:hypothetical protein
MLTKILKPVVLKIIKTPIFSTIIKNEIIEPNIVKYTTFAIIAPHGITDLIHAILNKKMNTLIIINILSISTFYILSKLKLYKINVDMFLLGSIIHFQRDFFIFKNKILQYLFSSIIVYSNYINNKIIYFYLLLFHVPIHYLQSFNFLINKPYLSFFIISFCTYLSVMSSYFFIDETKNKYSNLIQELTKGIIIAHVLYQEKFVHNI